MKVKSLSCVRLFVTPWTVAYQAPLSLGFSRHQYWNGLPFPSPRDLSNPGIEPRSPALQADSLPSEPPHPVHGDLTSLAPHERLPEILVVQKLNQQRLPLQGGFILKCLVVKGLIFPELKI